MTRNVWAQRDSSGRAVRRSIGTTYTVGSDFYLTTMPIRTTYQGPTDTRGSRIVARALVDGRRVQISVPFDYAARDTYAVAARALADRELGPDATVTPVYERPGMFVAMLRTAVRA